jgi:Cytochrome c3
VLVPAFFAIAIAALGLSAYSGASSSQGFAPLQPVDFPHPRHVQVLGINCIYCHYAAYKSPDPGLPAVSTCMGCHNIVNTAAQLQMGRGTPVQSSPGLAQLLRFAPAMQPDKWQRIPWIRIHKLPEYVHFPHMRHVNAGVTCQTCHGPIQTMMRVYQFSSLNMGWCVKCHVNGYSLADGLRAAGVTPTAGDEAVPVKKARYDCSVCHF